MLLTFCYLFCSIIPSHVMQVLLIHQQSKPFLVIISKRQIFPMIPRFSSLPPRSFLFHSTFTNRSRSRVSFRRRYMCVIQRTLSPGVSIKTQRARLQVRKIKLKIKTSIRIIETNLTLKSESSPRILWMR